MPLFSIEDFCSAMERNIKDRPTESLSHTAQSFLQALDLPRMHPFCADDFNFTLVDVPPMGSLLEDLHESRVEAWITYLHMRLPVLASFADLWFRLLAGFLAPLGVCLLLKYNVNALLAEDNKTRTSRGHLSFTIISTASFALVLMTDSMYVLEFGPLYGCTMFLAAMIMSLRLCFQYELERTRWMLGFVATLAVSLCFHRGHFYFGNPDDVDIRVSAGLYYNPNNTLIDRLVHVWPPDNYTYSNPTPWMLTGDARTGLPFFLYSQSVDGLPSTRVFLDVSDGEVLALDIYFSVDESLRATCSDAHCSAVPPPLYLILHGINGGSNEEYVKDFVHRATHRGSTVVVMVSRGLMDLPIRGWNIFHAARLTDVHEAATYLRAHVLKDGQILGGVGYSMGAIVLNNYAVSYGNSCALDVGFSVSGAMDCRHEAFNERAKRLWLPMVGDLTRFSQLAAKWANRLAHRLSRDDMLALLRAKNVVEADQYAAVAYNGYQDLMHYYSESGALGDVPWEHRESSFEILSVRPRVTELAIPLCVLQAFDDPISTFRTIVSNEGFMRPDSLVRMGDGYLVLLLTQRGGHVGWPEGWCPWHHKWKFQNEAAISFVEAMSEAKNSLDVMAK
ncbi:hypothetical protein MPSEU_000257300 [Mayamaea pseudoterrestris]|nr:hypothetical protein MPSEU_000257300 [Mayamaea pseudoterrestris]